jgi:hypothetical protein
MPEFSRTHLEKPVLKRISFYITFLYLGAMIGIRGKELKNQKTRVNLEGTEIRHPR